MEITEKITLDYVRVFMKWFSKCTPEERLKLLSVTLQFPLNIFINIDELVGKNFILPPALPDVFIRHLRPWEKHKSLWGNIPLRDFILLIQKEYESQEFPEGIKVYESEL